MTWLSAVPPVEQPASTAGIAVVELFTSEGCSSCPSADVALTELIEESSGKAVYALAYHVDYWDGLGWPDRFAEQTYTERQSRYAAAMNLNNVYTPQMIVNGKREFVGSDRGKLKAAVAEAISTPAAGTVGATATLVDGRFNLAITSGQLPAGTIINVALVEDGLTTDIRGGENRGRKLTHDHVVRAFDLTVIDDKGLAAVSLSIPFDVHIDRSTFILIAQRPADLQVLAATEVKIPK